MTDNPLRVSTERLALASQIGVKFKGGLSSCGILALFVGREEHLHGLKEALFFSNDGGCRWGFGGGSAHCSATIAERSARSNKKFGALSPFQFGKFPAWKL